MLVRRSAAARYEVDDGEHEQSQEALARGIVIGSMIAEMLHGKPAAAADGVAPARSGGVIGAVAAAMMLARARLPSWIS